MTLQCVDAPGIVLAASSAIVNVQGNILENDQFTDPTTGHFCMRTRFETTIDDFAVVQNVLTTELAKFSPTLKIRHEDQHRRALIMVSKFDHCLSDLLYRFEQGDIPLDIAAVVSNHSDCEALVKRYNIPFHYIPVTPETKSDAEDQLRALVKNYSIDFVVLARYMQILSPELCAQLSGQVINIHHSFLPGFKGAKPYHQAYDRGVKIIGATAHFVTNQLDEGPIIEQDIVRVSHSRTPQDMVTLGRDIERNVLSRAVGLVAQDRVALVGTRTVIFSQ